MDHGDPEPSRTAISLVFYPIFHTSKRYLYSKSMSLYSSSSSTAARHVVLRLYKDCLKSAFRIPDPSQRAVYIEYTREGFRSKRASHLVPESVEAIRAIGDAQEQLESMNYYHSIREMKERGEEYFTAAISGDTSSGIGVDSANDGWTSASSLDANVKRHDQQRAQPVGSNEGGLSSDGVPQVGNHLMMNQNLLVVETWLLTALPELHPDDLSTYSHRLMEDGFDSLTLLQMDLVQEDLDFMKKAHKRAIVRAYPLLV
jgi:hypothetical protein